MAEAQYIVEQIRAFLASSAPSRSPEVVDLARSYADLCREANERLRRCSDYLRRGLRSEAIEAADQHPPLIDLVAGLDFAEAGQWEAACAAFDLAKPPRLLIDAAAELNEAYAKEQPLKALLAQHRRLAMGRAPLRDRIAVMRQLAAADPQAAFWDEDLRAFETARLREMHAESGAAVRARDRQRLSALLAEASDGGWRIAVPEDLRKGIDAALQVVAREEAEAQVRRALPALDEAYLAMDQGGCRRIMEGIRQIASKAGLKVPADVEERICPVREWLDREAEREERARTFETSCAQLARAVDLHAPAAELERMRRAVVALGFEMPGDLSSRLRQEQQRQERARGRKRQGIIAVVAAVALIIVVAAVLVVRRQAENRQAQRYYRDLDAMVLDDRLEEASGLWDRIGREAPAISQRQEMRILKDLLDKKAAAERERKADFAAQLERAMAGGPLKPDTEALAQASLKAKTPAEKRQVLDFQTQIDIARAEAQKKRDDEFRKSVTALVGQVDDLDLSVRQGQLNQTAPIDAAEARLAALVAEPASDDLKRPLAPLRDRLTAIRHAYTRSAAERGALEKVKASAGSAKELKAALEAYAGAHPDSPRAGAFKKSAEDAPAWEAAEAWAALVEGWGGRLLPRAAEVGLRQQAVEAYLAAHGAAGIVPRAADYRDYLAQAQKALAANGPWKGELRTLLSSPLVRDLRSIRAKNGKVYYLPPQAKISPSKIGDQIVSYGFEAIISSDLSRVQLVTLRTDQVEGEPGPSPQAELAKELLGQLDALDDSEWETFGLGVIRAIHEKSSADPLLRAVLIQRVADLAMQAGWSTPDEVRAFGAALAALNADDLPWMNPDSAEAAAARPKAEEALKRIPDLKQARADVLARRQGMVKDLALRISGHGVLLRQGTDWELAMPNAPRGVHHLLIVATEGGQRTLRLIGQCRDGKAAIDPAKLEGMGEGAMVFLSPARGEG